jgi:hypothetical protein
MAKKTTLSLGGLAPISQTSIESSFSLLQQEYESAQILFDAQTQVVQRFIEGQARQLVDAILRNQLEVRFMLPEKVIQAGPGDEKPNSLTIPASQREQVTGSVLDRITRADMRTVLRHRLNELESDSNPGIAVSASLIRYAIAIHMAHNLLPSGRSVTYIAVDGEELPSIPSDDNITPESAFLAATDAVAEEKEDPGTNRGELQTPYVPDARRFYLPQWVAFDLEGKLLVNSVNEAEAHISSMRRFLSILHIAVSVAPFIVSDPVYQHKRNGMLGQLINQGRALAKFECSEIINTIKHRAANHDLNRGLSLSLPYFDDQELEIRTLDFELIPAGRIMFVPAFVVHAVREEMAQVAQDTRLSPSTRKYLLAELHAFELAFFIPGKTA